MIEKTIEIAGKPVAFRSSAAIPRLYRAKFGRDIFKDLSKLEKAYSHVTSEDGGFPIEDLEIFENVAYVMAFHADNTIPNTIEAWLDEFEMFSIYQVLPEILALWGENLKTEVTSKKRQAATSREMTTPLLLLRACQIGVPIGDMHLISIGLLFDMWTEKTNDTATYARVATQEDFDRF